MLKYFLGVEVMRSKQEILFSQWKYMLDLLFETGKLGAKLCMSRLRTLPGPEAEPDPGTRTSFTIYIHFRIL